MEGLDNTLGTMLYCLILISLWVPIYTFPILERHERPYIGLYDKLQNIFPVNDKIFQSKLKLIATPYILQ